MRGFRVHGLRCMWALGEVTNFGSNVQCLTLKGSALRFLGLRVGVRV